MVSVIKQPANPCHAWDCGLFVLAQYFARFERFGAIFCVARNGVKTVAKVINMTVDDDGAVVHKSVRDAWSRWQDERGYKFYHNRRAKTGMMLPLPEQLTWAERGQLNELANYLVEGCLVYRGNNNTVRALESQDMARVLNVSLRTAQSLIRHSVDVGVMAKVTVTQGRAQGLLCYMLNPLYFSSSDWIPVSLYLAFKVDIDKHLPGWAIQKYEAAMLGSDVQ